MKFFLVLSIASLLFFISQPFAQAQTTGEVTCGPITHTDVLMRKYQFFQAVMNETNNNFWCPGTPLISEPPLGSELIHPTESYDIQEFVPLFGELEFTEWKCPSGWWPAPNASGPTRIRCERTNWRIYPGVADSYSFYSQNDPERVGAMRTEYVCGQRRAYLYDIFYMNRTCVIDGDDIGGGGGGGSGGDGGDGDGGGGGGGDGDDPPPPPPCTPTAIIHWKDAPIENNSSNSYCGNSVMLTAEEADSDSCEIEKLTSSQEFKIGGFLGFGSDSTIHIKLPESRQASLKVHFKDSGTEDYLFNFPSPLEELNVDPHKFDEEFNPEPLKEKIPFGMFDIANINWTSNLPDNFDEAFMEIFAKLFEPMKLTVMINKVRTQINKAT